VKVSYYHNTVPISFMVQQRKSIEDFVFLEIILILYFSQTEIRLDF